MSRPEPCTRRPIARRLALLIGLAALVAGGCTDSLIPYYNGPSVGPVLSDRAELQRRVAGIAAGDRDQQAFQTLILETMGRDAYRIDIADSRYIAQPLGVFSPGAFIVDFLWSPLYRTVKSAQLLVDGATGAAFLSAQEKAGTTGYARTMKALEYIRLINTRDKFGLPIVSGSGGLDAVRCKPAVLDYIIALLDSAATDLGGGGAQFPFVLPKGFAGFDSPPTFLKFNRGLAAKVLMYKGYQGYSTNQAIDAAALTAALTALQASFIDPNTPSSFRTGVYHVYSAASGDQVNNNFNNAVYRVNPKVAADTERFDQRNAKFRSDPAQRLTYSAALSSDLLFTIVQSPTAPLPILINEELILTRAEIDWGLGNYTDALLMVNRVRGAYGLGPKTALNYNLFLTAADKQNFLLEILHEKRFSLLWESDMRIVDYRMFGLTSALGNESVNPGKEPTQVPFPQSEVDARGGDITCKA